MRIANRDSAQYAHKLLNFQGSNLHGVSESKYYIVYSYNWYPLFLYEYDTGVWYENETKYSVSTSKQTTQVRPSYITKKLSHQEIKNLL